MGRMKDMYIDMLNAGWEGPPNEYLEKHLREENAKKSEILCPNCMKEKLIQESKEDLSCINCGYDFIKINNNTVRFK